MLKINFEELNKKIELGEVLFVSFSAEWCGQCKMSKLLIEKLKGDYPHINFVEVDVDDNGMWDNDKFNISQVPTFVGFKDKKIIFNASGYQVEEALKELLNQL